MIASVALMPEAEFRQHLAFGREQPAVEFKGPGSRQNDGRTNISHLCARVIRAMLAMANQRDGGSVIIGVDEQADTLVEKGLTADELNSWRYDDLATTVSEFADPNLT